MTNEFAGNFRRKAKEERQSAENEPDALKRGRHARLAKSYEDAAQAYEDLGPHLARGYGPG